MKYNVVCPLAEKDVETYFMGLDILCRYVKGEKYVVIGNTGVCSLIREHNDKRVEFVDESQFITYERVREYIEKKTSDPEKSEKRIGWYLQQFLKLSYSLICKDEYYLLWDADTIPIHEHIMIGNGQPVFDMKTECHKPYFDTFSRLFPLYEKRNERSYISEHMIVKTEIMREMISEIEKSDMPGIDWYEKIIQAVDAEELPRSGFSDYETYGLFCLNKYPGLYRERKWDSLRPASSFFVYGEMRECDYEWLKKDYDAISFEANRKVKPLINAICRNSFIQAHFSCKKLLRALFQFTI